MIRDAVPGDVPAIAAIWNQAIAHTTITFNPDLKPEAEVAALTKNACLVWEEAGQVMGFARYFQFRGGAGYRYTAEHTIMLADAAKGRGGGTALMRALCDHAQTAGYHTLFAGCSAESPEAVQFHAGLGFHTVATLPEVGFKFGRWIDLVLMQKRL